MKTLVWMAIPLSQDLYALVDGEDFERLSKHKWYAHKGRNTYYAMRNTPRRNDKQLKVYMHREILGLPKGIATDHRAGYGLDNRRVNLRPATNQQNQFNRRSQYRKKSSQYKSVFWHKRIKKWYARIMNNHKRYFLGYFDTEKDAALAYNQAATKYFGEFAKLNNI